MKQISNKSLGIIIGIPLLLVTVLNVFGSDKNDNIPEECKPYIKECECPDISKKLQNILDNMEGNEATPEELASLGDILSTLGKNRKIIEKSSALDPELKFLTQSILGSGGGGGGGGGGSGGGGGGGGGGETKIIYLTSTIYVNSGGGGGGGGGSTRTPYRCPNPAGSPIEHGKSIFLYKDLVVNYPEQCQGENRVCDNGTLKGSFTQDTCIQNGKSCSTDRGVVQHGKTISSYRSLTVPYGGDCDKNIDIITCIDGKLSGELKFKSCTELAPKGCVGPDGKVRGHGVIGAYYSTAQLIGAVADGTDTCIRKSLECSNGTRRNTSKQAEGFGGFNQLTCTARINTQQ